MMASPGAGGAAEQTGNAPGSRPARAHVRAPTRRPFARSASTASSGVRKILAPVVRSNWIRVADDAAEPSALMMHLRSGFQSQGGVYLHHPEFMYEKFTMAGAETTTWYRVHMRGCVRGSRGATVGELLSEKFLQVVKGFRVLLRGHRDRTFRS